MPSHVVSGDTEGEAGDGAIGPGLRADRIGCDPAPPPLPQAALTAAAVASLPGERAADATARDDVAAGERALLAAAGGAAVGIIDGHRGDVSVAST